MYLGKQHHIAVICSSWEKAKEFYVDKLGFRLFREVYRPEKDDYLRMLEQGDTVLEIFIMPNNPERLTAPEAKGLRHLAFHVEDIEPAVLTSGYATKLQSSRQYGTGTKTEI